MKNDFFRIGILGGMGPEAGVLLQQLIIKATPASKDQEHIEVVTFTNPHIPDRTKSLKEDGGEAYLSAVAKSLQLLENAGADIIVMACNTAHARAAEIQRRINTPLLNIVELAKKEIAEADGKVGILATDGTVLSGLFSSDQYLDKIILPDIDNQREVMSIIHEIKKRGVCEETSRRLCKVVEVMMNLGCMKIVLGCTELSLFYDILQSRFGSIFIDPMRSAAKALVQLANKR